MFRSFRIRLALISALISGLVVLAFGALAWWSLNRAQIRTLDTDLRHFGYRVALRTGRQVDQAKLQDSLVDVFGAERAEGRFFTLMTTEKEPIVATANWPTSLRADEFSPGTEPLAIQPQDSNRRPSGNRSGPRIVIEPRFYTISVDGERYRIGVFSNSTIVFVLGANLQKQAQDRHQLQRAFLVALPGALLVVALGAAFVGWRALRPIETLGRDMKRVSAVELSHRLDLGEADREFETIIENYNAMLERLERSFHQANRFSADASHELKTPLAIMQGTLERALSQCGGDAVAQEALTEVLEQVGRQRAILESLLLLSRADAGKLAVSREQISLSELLETWLEDAGFLAEPRGITIRSEIQPDVRIDADPVLLQQVAHNLFANAVRYNREGGEIECRLRMNGEAVEWSVANTGSSIPEEERKRIFERFQRGTREDSGGGIGLGLSLVREIVQAHGGRVELVESEADRNCFQITL